MKRFFEFIFKFGFTPFCIIVTVIGAIVLALIGQLSDWKNTFDTILLPAVILVVTEALIVLTLMRNKIDDVHKLVALQEDDFTLVPPLQEYKKELYQAFNSIKSGDLKIICYGTNKFGHIIDHVKSHHPLIKITVIVCSPDIALHSSDKSDIQEIIEELRSDNITVYEANVLPTIRAALLRAEDGSAVWASVSSYLIHNKRRGMKSEGCSPVLISNISGSKPMNILVDFIDKEFKRLKEVEQTQPNPTTE